MLSRTCTILVSMGVLWILGSSVFFACDILRACNTQKGVPERTQKTVTERTVPLRESVDSHVFSPLTINFGINGDRILTEDVDQKLDQVLSYARAYPEDRIVVSGYTNTHSDTTFTDALGLSRAERIKNMLTSRGVSESQITTVSFGQRDLAGDPTTEEGRAKNRRVVVTAVPQ
jgi:OmpA-OmpF porin, OOP family